MDAVDQFCSSDPNHGFERLLSNHGEFLLAWLSKLFDGTSLDLEDVAQRSWYKAWLTRETFCARSPRLFKAWLFHIARNEALQDLRKRKVSDLPTDFDPVDDSMVEPTDRLDELEQRLNIMDSVSLTLGDPEFKNCLEQLKTVNESWFDALVSIILDEEGEETVLRKYQIDRPALSRRRWNAKQIIQKCMKETDA